MRRLHLSDARRAINKTALDVADEIGATEERIYAVERGRYRPRRDEALAWAGAVGLPPEAAFPELFDAAATVGGRS